MVDHNRGGAMSIDELRSRGMAKIQSDVRDALDESALRVGAPQDDSLLCLLHVASDFAMGSSLGSLRGACTPIDDLIRRLESTKEMP